MLACIEGNWDFFPLNIETNRDTVVKIGPGLTTSLGFVNRHSGYRF